MQQKGAHITVGEFYPRRLTAAEKSEECILIEVRSAAEFSQGHVPAARLVPLDGLPGAANLIARDQTVYLSCQSGMRSQQAMDDLNRVHGHSNPVNINGGTLAWMAAGYPVEQA